MFDHQAERELHEALRVQSMTPAQRWLWRQESWGRLQDSAAFLLPNEQPALGAARCYASLDEKNRFDEDREIRQALQLTIHMGNQGIFCRVQAASGRVAGSGDRVRIRSHAPAVRHHCRSAG